MPLYMTQFAYTPEAWTALVRSPEDRSEAVGRLLESMGGRLLSYYNSFGEYDGVIIFEAPDDNTAAAGVLAAVTPGHIKAIKTTTLLSVEDAMDAMRKAGEATFRRPGQQ
ncbi:GYD domain-containing protein [soil metagenome]